MAAIFFYRCARFIRVSLTGSKALRITVSKDGHPFKETFLPLYPAREERSFIL